MRILPIALSVLMIFTPAYSAYASMLPTKGQIVQIGKKGGALVRTGAGVAVKLGKVGRALTPVGAIVWCASNKKCKDKIDDAYEIACDISGVCTAERKDESDGQCIARFGDDKKTLSQLKSHSFVEDNDYERVEYNADSANFDNVEYLVNNKLQNMSTRPANWSHELTVQVPYKTKKYNKQYGWHSNSSTVFSHHVYIKCQDTNKLTQDEINDLAKKIAENMDDDDIKNYYNTDYDDITINNYHYYGDDIDRETNIDKYCESNACNEISKEIEKDINEKKYDIDDVTPANCTIEESTGKYIACNMTIKEGDENTQTPPKDDKDQTTPKKEDEEEPYLCGTTDLTKKICSFLDWSKSGDYDDEDDKVKIKESEEDKPNTKVEFTGTCPAPYEIDISLDAGFMGTIDYDFVLLDTPKLCTFLDDWVEPIVYVLGPLHAIYILGGNRENV